MEYTKNPVYNALLCAQQYLARKKDDLRIVTGDNARELPDGLEEILEQKIRLLADGEMSVREYFTIEEVVATEVLNGYVQMLEKKD